MGVRLWGPSVGVLPCGPSVWVHPCAVVPVGPVWASLQHGGTVVFFQTEHWSQREPGRNPFSLRPMCASHTRSLLLHLIGGGVTGPTKSQEEGARSTLQRTEHLPPCKNRWGTESGRLFRKVQVCRTDLARQPLMNAFSCPSIPAHPGPCQGLAQALNPYFQGALQFAKCFPSLETVHLLSDRVKYESSRLQCPVRQL